MLTPLETASGLLFGSDPGSIELVRAGPDETARTALERSLLPALERPPCLVSFSGGRDSSALLAVAAHVARREGLEQPVPYTLRFPHAPDTDETEWQERVVAHVSVADWTRLDLDDELDCVGPIAQRVLRRHGLLWPMNSHFMAPAAEAAGGGSLVTGTGGDQMLSASRLTRHRRLLAGAVRPRPRDILRIGYAAAPPPVRRAIVRRRVECPLELPWLRPEAREAAAEGWVADEASEPIRPRQHIRWILGLRALRVGLASFELVAGQYGTRLVHPFMDMAFASALTRPPARSFYTDRTRMMRELVGDLLPDDVCARTSKAVFQTPFWNRHTQAFLERWDGSGVDEALVDTDELRAYWSCPEPSAQSMTLLQATWLETDRRRTVSDPSVVEPVEQERSRVGA